MKIPRCEMLEGLSFIFYTLTIGLWVFVWGALGALVANSRGQSFLVGFIQGTLLGPLGVVLMPLLASFRGTDRTMNDPSTPSDMARVATLDEEYG